MLIALDRVSKDYQSGPVKVSALKRADLAFLKADFVSIVGPSGAGKSTLLHVMGGLDAPTSGVVFFEDKNIYDMSGNELSSWRRREVGFVFQLYHLIEELNILENITISAIGISRKEALKKGRELLEYLGIEERAGFFPSQLSGGQKQKVAIARALINEPKILFCDEPTGNLDKDSQDRVMALLQKVNNDKEMAVVLVTHNNELADVAKKKFYIEDGMIQNSI